MLIIPEIQLQNEKVVTRSSIDGSSTIHDISPIDALRMFSDGGAQMIQIVDVDAARGQPTNNCEIVKELISQTELPVQVAGGIRTLAQINDWFEAGAARVVLGTVAITDTPMLMEAANQHPGGVVVHLATRDGYVMIDGWKTQTAFQAGDLIQSLQGAGIAAIVHKDTESLDVNFVEALALSEALGQDVPIPIYSSGTVRTLDDISRLRYMPNISGAVISHAFIGGDITIEDALQITSQKEAQLQPESVTQNISMGVHYGVRAYLAAYTSSQASRVWSSELREAISVEFPNIEVSIPQIDLAIDGESLSPREIQAAYEVELDKADILLVVLEGVEAEAWTGFECGYARAKGKYIFGITSEENADDVAQERFTTMCDELIFYTSGDDVKKSHSEIASALASHVMMRAQWGDVATPAAVPTS